MMTHRDAYTHTHTCTHLCDAVVLQVDDSRDGHLHAAEHCDDFQDFVIERWSGEGLRQREDV